MNLTHRQKDMILAALEACGRSRDFSGPRWSGAEFAELAYDIATTAESVVLPARTQVPDTAQLPADYADSAE